MTQQGLAQIDDVDRTPDVVYVTSTGGEYHARDCPSLKRAYGEPTALVVGEDALFRGRDVYDRTEGRELGQCGRCRGGLHG